VDAAEIMSRTCEQHRPFGKTGLAIPPIVFGAAALGNARRVITEQSKLAICGEWFRQVAPPVVVDVAFEHGNGLALEVLGRMLRRLEVTTEEVIISLGINGTQPCWEKSCQLLSDEYEPKLVSVDKGDDAAWEYALELKAAGRVQGVGFVTSDFVMTRECLARFEPDWITVASGFSVMRHSEEQLALLAELADREIPVVAAGLFEGGFLVGDNRLDGSVVSAENPSDRSLLAWRKAFVALCDGHGISPSHACIQFAISAPGVVAVLVESSYPDRVAENVNSVCRRVPANFWQSMKEEGLLAEDWPLGM
jgi:D-threo-aldose 1-dehydrogenase